MRTRLTEGPDSPAAHANDLLVRAEGGIHRWLVLHSITALRVSMGLVFVGFGVLKFFPGVSPAEDLVEATISQMTFGLMPDRLGVALTAVLECAIGLSLITGLWLRLTVYLLAAELVGILSPLVLLPGRLFSGPGHAPTLEGQYVLKDVVLVAAAMVVATQFRGATITAPDQWDLATHSLPEDSELSESTNAAGAAADPTPAAADVSAAGPGSTPPR